MKSVKLCTCEFYSTHMVFFKKTRVLTWHIACAKTTLSWASQLMCAKTFSSLEKFEQGFMLVLFEPTWILSGIQFLCIYSKSLLQKRTDSNWTVLIEIWSMQETCVRAWLQEANAEREHFMFPCELAICSSVSHWHQIRRKSTPRGDILFASTENEHWPRSHTPLHFDIGNIL